MKCPAFFLLFFLIAIQVSGQGGNNNRKPRIQGQDPISTNEDQSVTVLMSHLDVEDPDDWFYPWGFTMQLYEGDNYTFQGHVVTPARDFSGVLTVSVTVHDGVSESNRFDLKITVNPVNDKPVITAHQSIAINENQSVTLVPSNISVSDPDDRYPDDFTFQVHNGSNYSVNGMQVTPQTGFVGTLTVHISVYDGALSSDVYSLPITVNAVNRIPVITGQVAIQVNEDQVLALSLSQLTVVDEDSNYPEGFTLNVGPGQNYTASNNTITPATDFFGRLLIPVTVNDGKNTSKPFNLSVTVTPVNDIPAVTALETEPLPYHGATPVSISATVSVSEVDGDSIMFAEIRLDASTYQIGTDKLVYTAPEGNSIRGVFDSNSGILTLLGQASPSRYAQALRSVAYESTIPPAGAGKTVVITVNDGKSDSEPVQRDIVFGHVSVVLDIPTGFTPNGDLSNDTWKIIPLKSEEMYTHARIRVYNKSGVLVYESTGFEGEWDGRLDGELLPADTYFYTIDLNIDSPEGYLKGLVTILR